MHDDAGFVSRLTGGTSRISIQVNWTKLTRAGFGCQRFPLWSEKLPMLYKKRI